MTTVRSQQKADKIKKAHPYLGKDKLDFAIVEDIVDEKALDEVVTSDPPFEAVIHTASPLTFNVKDIQTARTRCYSLHGLVKTGLIYFDRNSLIQRFLVQQPS